MSLRSSRLPLIVAPQHLVELWVLRITKDLEIDSFLGIAVEGIVHRLLGQVGYRLAEPAEKPCHHGSSTGLRNFPLVIRTRPDCKRRPRTPYRTWDVWER